MGFTKPEECSTTLDVRGLDKIFAATFEPGKPFVGPTYDGSFVLPLESDEKKRDVYVGVQNLENNLDLQVIVSCDGNNVKGYLLTAEVNSVSQDIFKIDTATYSCGDKVRIQQN